MLKTPRRDVYIAGHRGNAVSAPENSTIAFTEALDLGADAIETDVRLSRDGIPILFHDPDLTRIAGSEALVGDLTLEELQRIDIGTQRTDEHRGAAIPTLFETAELCRDRAKLILDLKMEGCVEAIAAACRDAAFAQDQLHVCAWTDRQAKDVLRHLPDSRLIHLTQAPLTDGRPSFFAGLATRGYHGLSQRLEVLEAETVRLAHQHGLEVITWTIDSAQELDAALTLDVDGIISNDPGGIIKIFGETHPI